MATSGTVGVTQLDVITIIEKAIRKCGKPPSIVDTETLLDAQSELFTMTQALANDGVLLWTVEKKILGAHINQVTIDLPNGVIDVGNCLWRTNYLPSGGVAASSAGGVAAFAFDQNLTTACIQTAPNGNISYQFPNPVPICTVGLLPGGTGFLNPIYELSIDGINWVTAIPAETSPVNYVAGTWYWQDVLNPYQAQFFRVRETSGGTLNMIEVVFGTAPYELPMSRQNKDDYQNLPNKMSQGRPLQFWVDRQIAPRIWVWQVPMIEFGSIAAWCRREIMDIGSFTNTIEFPNRWLDDIITDLASRISLLPGLSVNPNRIAMLQQMAQNTAMKAWQEERDNSPVFVTPEISGYTR